MENINKAETVYLDPDGKRLSRTEYEKLQRSGRKPPAEPEEAFRPASEPAGEKPDRQTEE